MPHPHDAPDACFTTRGNPGPALAIRRLDGDGDSGIARAVNVGAGLPQLGNPTIISNTTWIEIQLGEVGRIPTLALAVASLPEHQSAQLNLELLYAHVPLGVV